MPQQYEVTDRSGRVLARHGDKGDPVESLQQYLRRFGYLREAPGTQDGFAAIRSRSAPIAEDAVLDEATVVGLQRFQRFVGLPVTGVLDEATLAQMGIPRCGFPDVTTGTTVRVTATGVAAPFVVQGNRWATQPITWRIVQSSADLGAAAVRNAFVAAFELWTQVADLRFQEVTGDAQIRISFVAADHGDGSPFDGVGNVLAHAFYPPPKGGDVAGDAHFDEAETWSTAIPVPAGRTDLVTVAAHELGHALGLNHSADSTALMAPFYGGPHRFLAADDVLGITSIYGSRVHAVPGWFGAEDQGADIAIANVGNGGRPDLVVFHLDNPGGDNHGYYRVGWNLDGAGRVTAGWSQVRAVPGWFGWENQGAGIALADVNGSGRQDLVVFHVDNPSGDNHGYYRVGWDLDGSGAAQSWSRVHAVPGWFGWENQGAAIALADINRSGRQDLVVFHLDNPGGENHGYYRVGWNLDGNGFASGGWSPVKPVPGWFGAEDQGAGIAIADVNGNGRPDLVVFHLDNPGGENHGYYRVGWDLDAAGNVTGGWSTVVGLPGWFGAEDQGAGIALADLDGTGRQELVVFHVDNPGGENHGYYRVITNL